MLGIEDMKKARRLARMMIVVIACMWIMGDVALAQNVYATTASGNVIEINQSNYVINGSQGNYDGTNVRVSGGYTSTSETVTRNYVTVYETPANSNFGSLFGGGRSLSVGSATDNHVIIKGGYISNIYGGFSTGGIASKNTVTMEGGNGGSIFGGFAPQASDNVVNVNGGTVDGSIVGAEVHTLYGYNNVVYSVGDVYNNGVRISNGTINGSAIGGNGVNEGSGNTSNNVYGNYVTVNDGILAGATGGSGGINNHDNIVTINGGNVSGAIVGGYSAGATSRNVTNNTVTITGGEISSAGVTGGVSGDSGSLAQDNNFAQGNKVILEGGSFKTNSLTGVLPVICGGISYGGEANDNEVTIKTDNLNLYGLYGGQAFDKSIASTLVPNKSSGNTLNLYSKNIHTDYLSGFQKINFNLNESITAGSTMLTVKYGGNYSSNNGIDLTNTEIDVVRDNDNLTKGQSVTLIQVDPSVSSWNGLTVASSLDGTTLSNDVTITTEKDANGLITSIVAHIGEKTIVIYNNASNNSVTITDSNYTITNDSGTSTTAYTGDFSHDVYGGTATANAIASSEITGGTESDSSADASNNSVTITSGNITGHVVGGETHNGNAAGNTVTVNGGSVSPAVGVVGGISYGGNASGNRVVINDGTTYHVYGGGVGSVVSNDHGDAAANPAGYVSNNAVVINGGEHDSVYGGFNTGSGEVSNNTVTINGGAFDGTYSEGIMGGFGADGNVFGNVVNINGGTLQNYGMYNAGIYGGYSESGSATNNTVNISGSPDLTGSIIYGGYSENGNVSGNTLNLRTSGIVAKNIYNFDNINFYLPASAAKDATVLTLTDESGTDLRGVAFGGGVGGSSSAQAAVGSVTFAAAGDSAIEAGDTLTLITNEHGLTLDNNIKEGTLSEGVTFTYPMTFSASGNSLVGTVGERTNTISEDKKAITQGGVMSRIVPVNIGSDFVYQNEINQSNPLFGDSGEYSEKDKSSGEDSQALGEEPEQKPDWNVFLTTGGSWLRTKGSGGSYADSKIFGSNLGMARSFGNERGRLMVAPIIDYGSGSYDSYLSEGTHGSGSQKYWAGGAVLRQTDENGFYYGGSFRMGRVTSDFASNDILRDGQPTHVDYDTASRYWAGHIDLGRLISIDRENVLDLYGVYFHSRIGGMDAKLSTGESYRFDAVNNHRARIGARLTRRINENSRFYSGLAVQYERYGAPSVVCRGEAVPSGGSVSGTSGMIELGWQMRMSKDSPVALNVSATGWVGHQRGFSVQAKFEKAF